MPKSPKPLRGLALANVAVLFFGLAGILGKLSVLPAPLLVFGRAFFAGLVLLAVCWFQHIPLSGRDGCTRALAHLLLDRNRGLLDAS